MNPAPKKKPIAGETDAHRLLKLAALRWAQQQGYRAAGLEVALPNSRYRADAAACRLTRPEPRQLVIDRVAVFECKQARPDFLNDARPEAESIARLAHLNRRREKLERLVGTHYPSLRHGDSLFPEYDGTDVEAIRHDGYRKVIAEIRTLETAVFGRTKFDKLVRYRCADLFYLVIRPGILKPEETPSQWGLLIPADDDPDFDRSGSVPELKLVRKPFRVEARDRHRLEILHRLAIAGTWRLNREAGLDFDDVHETGLGAEDGPPDPPTPPARTGKT